MLTIAAVLREGGDYTEFHLQRLYRLVRAHMRGPFVWQSVTDSPYPGWWSKISLFEPGRFEGRVLYLDLDTTPFGDLDDLADFHAPGFVACKDWQGLGINSSVMAWTPSRETERIYTEFAKRPDKIMARMRGDQNWIADMAPWETFPRRWCQSYKADYQRNGWHPDTRVQVFHGRPRPWEVG